MTEKPSFIDMAEFGQRRQLVESFISKPKVEIARQLLAGDPMTVQEAGVVARALRDLFRGQANLSKDEWLDLYGGDYKTAEAIFQKNDLRNKIWEKSVSMRDDSEEEIYLFREININIQQVKEIKRHGLMARGIHDSGNLENVLGILLDNRKVSGIGDLPISKFNLFQDVWWMDLDFGSSNPHKLGLSFTTYENLHSMGRMVFGRHMIVARLPSNLVVRENDKHFDGIEDERTLLFSLPAKNVVSVLDTKDGSKREILKMAEEAIKKDKLKRKLYLK